MTLAIGPHTRRSGTRTLAIVLVALSVLAGTTTMSMAWFTDRESSGGSLAADTLAPPTGLGATGGASAVVTWTATTATYAAGYHVLRATVPGGPYSQIAVVTPRTATTYTDTPAGGTYWYSVRSYVQGWESVDAGPVAATVGAWVSTGPQPCVGSSNAADTSGAGDNNGYQTRANRACAPDNRLAVDTNTGTGGTESCGSGATPDPQKDRHRWWGFSFGLPGIVTSVDGIQVEATLRLDSGAGNSNVCAQLSGDGGLSWTTIQSVPVSGGATMTTYSFGGPSDRWGRAWTVGDLATTAFRVRIIDASDRAGRDFRLDYLAVDVTYTP
jgi:hypothetical protein